MNKTNDIQNRETRVDTNAQEEVQAAEAQPQNGENPEVKNTDKAGRIKQVATGAGGAIAGAAGAVAIMGFVVPDDAPEPPADSHPSAPAGPLPTVADFDGSEIPAASHVNDDMSFADAFASARQETGPGGVFFWRGGVYGTYYRDEWDQLSPEYRETFSNYPYHRPADDGLAADAATATEEQANATDTSEHATAATGDNPAAEQVQADVAPVPANDTGSADTAGDAEVLGVQYVDVDGQTVAVASVSVDGRDALLVDVDTDGVFDYAIADNGTPEPEVFDISEQQITHEDAADIQQAQQQASDTDDNYLESNHLPDYTNDASVEHYTNA
jgi:hypothetical protein